MASIRRLQIIHAHMCGMFPEHSYDPSLDQWRTRGLRFDRTELRTLFFQPNPAFLDEALEEISKSEYLDRDYLRNSNRIQLQEANHFGVGMLLYRYKRSKEELQRSNLFQIVVPKAANYYLLGSTLKFGGFQLVYDAVRFLGTEKHSDILDDIVNQRDFYSFCMTELGHGSNTQAMETTAIYQHSSRTFVVNSPTSTSIKIWPGGLAKTANKILLYARLIIDQKDYGVHGFIVTIRSAVSGKALKGCTIGDLGPKTVANGADNGFLSLKDVVIPYDNMLDKLSQIDENGQFQSDIQNNKERLSVMLSAFSGPRIGVVVLPPIAMHLCLQIAIRYMAVRRQFALEGKIETSVLDYPSQQYKIMTNLARMFTSTFTTAKLINFGGQVLKSMEISLKTPEVELIHLKSSILKPLFTAYGAQAAQQCREGCAAHGYSYLSRLDELRAAVELCHQLDGDSGMIYQSATQIIIKQLLQKLQGKNVTIDLITGFELDPELILKPVLFQNADELTFDKLLQLQLAKSNIQFYNGMMWLNAHNQEVDSWDRSLLYGLKQGTFSIGEYYTAQTSLEAIQNVRDQNLKLLLEALIRLYQLDCISNDASDILNKSISFDQLNIIRREIQRLCSFLAENSVNIIDAIQVNDKIVGSTLGKYDGQVYKHIASELEKIQPNYKDPKWVQIYLKNRISSFNPQLDNQKMNLSPTLRKRQSFSTDVLKQRRQGVKFQSDLMDLKQQLMSNELQKKSLEESNRKLKFDNKNIRHKSAKTVIRLKERIEELKQDYIRKRQEIPIVRKIDNYCNELLKPVNVLYSQLDQNIEELGVQTERRLRMHDDGMAGLYKQQLSKAVEEKEQEKRLYQEEIKRLQETGPWSEIKQIQQKMKEIEAENTMYVSKNQKLKKQIHELKSRIEVAEVQNKQLNKTHHKRNLTSRDSKFQASNHPSRNTIHEPLVQSLQQQLQQNQNILKELQDQLEEQQNTRNEYFQIVEECVDSMNLQKYNRRDRFALVDKIISKAEERGLLEDFYMERQQKQPKIGEKYLVKKTFPLLNFAEKLQL